MKKAPKVRTSKESLRKIDNASKALSMRAKGYTYREIGRLIGVSHVQAYRYVLEHIEQVRANMLEDAVIVLAIELERLDAMTVGIYQRAVSGEVDAIGTMLKIMQRRARLLGLDAPAKTEQRPESTTAELDREHMRIVLSDPEARAALDAYNEAARKARERADKLTRESHH